MTTRALPRPPAPPRKSAVRRPPSAARAERARLVVASADPRELERVVDLLGPEAEVAPADGGPAALDAARARRPRVVVVDEDLPRGGAQRLIRELSGDRRLGGVPVALLSSAPDPAERALALGADHALARPASRAALLLLVRSIGRAARAERQAAARARRAAREAEGRARLGAEMLHTVGNVLNGALLALHRLRKVTRAERLDGLGKALDLLPEQPNELAAFLTEDPRGRRLPEYLGRVAQALGDERTQLQGEVGRLADQLDLVGDLIGFQQETAREPTPPDLGRLVERTVALHRAQTREELEVLLRIDPGLRVAASPGGLAHAVWRAIKAARVRLQGGEEARELVVDARAEGPRIRLDVAVSRTLERDAELARLVEELGGRLEHHVRGAGTTLALDLPRAR